jgi:hypothetical protein
MSGLRLWVVLSGIMDLSYYYYYYYYYYYFVGSKFCASLFGRKSLVRPSSVGCFLSPLPLTFRATNAYERAISSPQTSVPQRFHHVWSFRIIFHILRNPKLWKRLQARKEIGRWWRTVITPALPITELKCCTIFQGIFRIFRGFAKFIYLFTTISRGTPNDVLRDAGWKTQSKSLHRQAKVKQSLYRSGQALRIPKF